MYATNSVSSPLCRVKPYRVGPHKQKNTPIHECAYEMRMNAIRFRPIVSSKTPPPVLLVCRNSPLEAGLRGTGHARHSDEYCFLDRKRLSKTNWRSALKENHNNNFDAYCGQPLGAYASCMTDERLRVRQQPIAVTPTMKIKIAKYGRCEPSQMTVCTRFRSCKAFRTDAAGITTDWSQSRL